MHVINKPEISDPSRLMIGRVGTIGFGFLPLFLFFVLESSVLFFVTWVLLSTLPFIVLMWWIFPYLSAHERSDMATLFLFGPAMLFQLIQIGAIILEMNLPVPVLVTLAFEWLFNACLIMVAYLRLVSHSCPK